MTQAEHQRRWYEKHGSAHKANVAARNQRIRKENFQRIYAYLAAHPCVDCKEQDPIVLEFDHVRGTKRSDVSHMAAQAFCWNTIESEIAKCDIRCANCHRRKTAREQGWLEYMRP